MLLSAVYPWFSNGKKQRCLKHKTNEKVNKKTWLTEVETCAVVLPVGRRSAPCDDCDEKDSAAAATRKVFAKEQLLCDERT